MKKLILSITLAGLALAVQAGAAKTAKTGNDASASCCCDDKPAKQAKAECSATKQTKTACSAGKEMTSKRALSSPKALADAR